MGIHSTPMEGIDPELIGKLFKEELDGMFVNLPLAMGYPLEAEDYNYGKPKALQLKEMWLL